MTWLNLNNRWKGNKMTTKKGSYLLGIIGAILGMIVAMIPYIFVYYLGYIVFWLGFLFIILTTKGYFMLNGRRGYGQIPIIIFFSGCGLLLSVLALDIWSLIKLANEEPSITYGMIPQFIYYEFMENSQYRNSLIKDLFLSGITYVIGIFYFVVQSIREINAEKQLEAQNQQMAYYGEQQAYPQNYPNAGQNMPQNMAQNTPENMTYGMPYQEPAANLTRYEEVPYGGEEDVKRPEE